MKHVCVVGSGGSFHTLSIACNLAIRDVRVTLLAIPAVHGHSPLSR
jgi:hypothetical protein